MIFYLLWSNVIPWSSHIYKKTSFLSFHCLIFSVNNTGETIESNWQNVIHVELNGIKNSIMQLTFFLDGPMANSLFYFFKKKWLLNKNLVLILLLNPKLSGKFQRFNHCVKSIRIRSYSGLHFPEFGLNLDLVQMRENADQNNSEYGHFLRSECFWWKYCWKTVEFPKTSIKMKNFKTFCEPKTASRFKEIVQYPPPNKSFLLLWNKSFLRRNQVNFLVYGQDSQKTRVGRSEK